MKSKSIIAILSIVSITLAVCFISMFITHSRNSAKATNQRASVKNNTMLNKDYSKHFMTYFLELDTTQTALFKSINDAHIANKKMIAEQIMALNEEFSTKLGSGDITENDKESFYTQLINLHYSIGQENYLYYTKLRAVCNDAQKIKCDKFFKSTMCIDHSQCQTLKFQEGVPSLLIK